MGPTTSNRLQDPCHYAAAEAETDPTKRAALLKTAQACLDRAKAGATQSLPLVVFGSSGTPDATPAKAATPALAVGTNASQNAYATPNACAVGTGDQGRATGQALLYVHRQLLRQQDVEDDFGRRLGQRFLVYQVTVTNGSKDFQYEVGDISVDLKDVLTAQGATPGKNHAMHQGSSETLEMLRGVPEKGQDLDPRNLTLHILQGVGTVGAAVSGLTPFSDVMGSAMANFNGAFIQAFTGIAPDHSATQLNRLSDMAFTANTLIGKLQTKTYAVFLPKSFILTKANERAFKKDPRTLLNKVPVDQANVCVDGILLVQVATTADPTLSPLEANVIPGTAITLSESTPGADIYYTTNGDTPTLQSTKYSAAVPVGGLGSQTTIKAFAIAPNLGPSNIIVKTFLTAAQATAPTVTLDVSTSKVQITAAPEEVDDAIYYTTDGTSPDTGSTRYVAEFSVTSGQTVTAVAIGSTTSLSKVATYKAP